MYFTIHYEAALWRLSGHCFTALVVNVFYRANSLFYFLLRAPMLSAYIFHAENNALELRLQSFAIQYHSHFYEKTRTTAVHL